MCFMCILLTSERLREHTIISKKYIFIYLFFLHIGEVIKAWDIGVATMKKGEKCTLVCHPDYAYGKQGSKPKIPENATLVFDVELIKWQMEDLTSEKDGGILRSIIQEGEGYLTPSEGATVEGTSYS